MLLTLEQAWDQDEAEEAPTHLGDKSLGGEGAKTLSDQDKHFHEVLKKKSWMNEIILTIYILSEGGIRLCARPAPLSGLSPFLPSCQEPPQQLHRGVVPTPVLSKGELRLRERPGPASGHPIRWFRMVGGSHGAGQGLGPGRPPGRGRGPAGTSGF